MRDSSPRRVQPPYRIEVAATARFLRWLACSLLPDVYAAVASSGDDKWAEASTLAYLWQGVEDEALCSWAVWVRSKEAHHVSLHFDGVRVDHRRVAAEAAAEGAPSHGLGRKANV